MKRDENFPIVGSGNQGTGQLLIHRWRYGRFLLAGYTSACSQAFATSVDKEEEGKRCKRCFPPTKRGTP